MRMPVNRGPWPVLRQAAAAALMGIAWLTMPASAAEPWRLKTATGAPDWLDISGSYRVRYEGVADGFRPGQANGDQILVERLLLSVEADLGGAYVGAEFQDSRSHLDGNGTPLGTDDVNAAELLRAYLGFKGGGVLVDGDKLDVQAGRMTVDSGSRRLVSRNNFRNTINAFTGIQGMWTGPSGWRVQAFVTLPVERQPSRFADLDENRVEFDDENFDTILSGLHLSRTKLIAGATGEVYVYRLDEEDGDGRNTADRELWTPGVRLVKARAKGAFDWEIEATYQTGTSRSSTAASNVTDLDHRAGFFHVHLGRSFDVPWAPRAVLQFDYATGDGDPTDGRNGRFDTLYGGRRSEFGPTGIWGPLARGNLITPGFQVDAGPTSDVSLLLGYRAAWLEEARDTFVGAGLRNITGRSGTFFGHQMEGRVQLQLIPGNLMLELGGSVLTDGEFLREAPAAPDNGAAYYGYSQLVFTF